MSEVEPLLPWNADGGAWNDLADSGLTGGRFDPCGYGTGSSRFFTNASWAMLLGALAQTVIVAQPIVLPAHPPAVALELSLFSHKPDISKLDFLQIEAKPRHAAGDPDAASLLALRRLSETAFSLALPSAVFHTRDGTIPYAIFQIRRGPLIRAAAISAHTRIALARFVLNSPLADFEDPAC